MSRKGIPGDNRNSAVASLANRSPHPYSSVALSPSRSHAIVAGKDTLRVLSVGSDGLAEKKMIRISQHFQTSVASTGSATRTQSGGKSYGDVRDTFGLGKQHPRSPQNITASDAVNVIVTDVAWSMPQLSTSDKASNESFRENENLKSRQSSSPFLRSSVVAAAGSNGVVVIWNAEMSFLSGDKTQNPLPEAVLSQHSRAVNRLAWHPGKKSCLLLTASQDATVKLWERRSSFREEGSGIKNAGPRGKPKMRSWFGMHAPFHQDQADRSISWHCRATFKPKSEAVRDIQWSPFHEDVFAMVTDSGSLIVYNICVVARPWVKIAAHSGEATTVDWHPTRPYVVATGGSDRTVKIWDLESGMSLSTDDRNVGPNSNSERSGKSQAESDTSNDDTVRAGSMARNLSTHESGESNNSPVILTSFGHSSVDRFSSSSVHSINSIGGQRSKKPGVSTLLHVLSVSAAVTRLTWRPPEVEVDELSDFRDFADRHDAMLAVATGPISGASAGGNGLLSLWSHHRPFMALSVLEGHKEGAVTDFIWLDTPYVRGMFPDSLPSDKSTKNSDLDISRRKSILSSDNRSRHDSVGSEISRHMSSSGDIYSPGKIDMMNTIGVWQHVLSVGRDGRCLLQSFARGERPISKVPPSCFALANLSPFQSGYGSLQIFAVHQSVPSGKENDFLLTALRTDSVTALGPGVFQETLPNGEEDALDVDNETTMVGGMRHPARKPQLAFDIIDQGELDEGDAVPISTVQSNIVVAPEVVHLSRFAQSYKFYPDEECPTRVDLCLHNANIAECLRCGSLARMWAMLASICKGSGLSELPYRCAPVGNVMGFALLPTLKTLLEQRADAGDVQTCVALCEVMQVIEKPRGEDQTSTRVPGIEVRSKIKRACTNK
mmetsp:Transcript_19354/g.27360  ORF Transcript_19354/g.27360 Transcript_19354/m.27360 type:complete len:890 (-) Transcript_19354:965-3634(-)